MGTDTGFSLALETNPPARASYFYSLFKGRAQPLLGYAGRLFRELIKMFWPAGIALHKWSPESNSARPGSKSPNKIRHNEQARQEGDSPSLNAAAPLLRASTVPLAPSHDEVRASIGSVIRGSGLGLVTGFKLV